MKNPKKKEEKSQVEELGIWHIFEKEGKKIFVLGDEAVLICEDDTALRKKISEQPNQWQDLIFNSVVVIFKKLIKKLEEEKNETNKKTD